MNQFSAPFLLGIDVGTTGCKTELLDVEGNTVARSYREYPLIYPRISWVEHDAETGWVAGNGRYDAGSVGAERHRRQRDQGCLHQLHECLGGGR